MENILLILNIVFAFILVILVLMQKSEGGALGIGVSEESYMLVCPQLMLTTPRAFAFGQALIRDKSMSAFHSVWS